MICLFLLSGENTKFALAEVKAQFKVKNAKLDDRVLIAEILDFEGKKTNNLAYTHRVYEFLFISDTKDLLNKLKTYDFTTIYKKDFVARIIQTGSTTTKYTEKQLGSIIWRNLTAANIHPKVNLENPATQIDFIFVKNKVYCGRLVNKIHHDFEQRKAHKRKVIHPSSLHPKLARGMVNLLGIDRNNENTVICDPFVGTAGILIEAGLLGYKTLGFDINKWMVKAATDNLKSYKIINYKIINTDALNIKNYKNIQYIAADLPYSINTKEVDIVKLYSEFLALLKKIKVKRAVLGFPHFTNYKNLNYKTLIKKNKLNLISEFKFYLHKNLSK